MEKTKKVLNIVLLTLRKTGLYFMIMSLLIALLGVITESGQYFKTEYFVFILIASLLFAIESFVFNIEKIKAYILRVVIHYFATTITLVFVIVISKITTEGRALFLLVIAYTILYAIVIGVYSIFKHILNKKEQKEKNEYKSQFSKEENDK